MTETNPEKSHIDDEEDDLPLSEDETPLLEEGPRKKKYPENSKEIALESKEEILRIAQEKIREIDDNARKTIERLLERKGLPLSRIIDYIEGVENTITKIEEDAQQKIASLLKKEREATEGKKPKEKPAN